MLERLSKNTHFCYLDGYSGFSKIHVITTNQEKTTFTCPYGTYSYRCMPFGLCNAPTTFHRCMSPIFHGFCEEIVEVFMDDFSIYGTSFDNCLHTLNKVLQLCEETNLVLNWEKCHFMVSERFPKGEWKWTRRKLKLLKGCPIQGKSKVFVVFSVMMVSIEDLSRTFLRLRDPSLIFSRRMFLFYSMKIVRKPSKFLRKP